uniref:V-type proton ATPase subunit C n=1 Tax=Geospiza parvula TaxID=87175 RepID=A0A8U8AYA8_GEOPR
MSEFWLISAPGDKTNLQAWERMNTVTSKSNLSSNSKFHIPDLKVGTLDALVGLSDELGKLDTFAEREAVSHKETALNGGLWGYFVLCFCFYFKEHPPTSSRNLIKQHLENVKPSLILF